MGGAQLIFDQWRTAFEHRSLEQLSGQVGWVGNVGWGRNEWGPTEFRTVKN